MTQAIPEGMEGLIPHLVCTPCKDAIEFYKKAFGAEEMGILPAPDGERIMHAYIKLGNKSLFLVDDFPEYCGGAARSPQALGGSSVTIHQYVEDCDASIKRAEEAGAKVTMPPMDAFWGDRYGMVEDPFGHAWSFATHQKDLTPEEVKQGMDEAFSQQPGS